MSFILDALRKSESDRQRLSSVALAELPIGRRHRGQPWWVFALGALLLVNVIVLAVVLLRDRAPITPTATAVTPTPVAAPAITAQVAPQTQPPIAAITPSTSNPLQDAAARVEYETVPASEKEIIEAASSVPDGPTLVKPSNAQSNEIKLANELAAQTSQELRLDLHVFSRNSKERFVMINMRRYVEGQQLPGGATVEQITPEGVVLYQNGTRYLLDRS